MNKLILAFGSVAIVLYFALGLQSPKAGLSSRCQQTPMGAISLPDSHADELATLLNAADVLNQMGTCVIEGGWSVENRQFYLTVQEPGQQPTIRRLSGPEMRSLASLGQRTP